MTKGALRERHLRQVHPARHGGGRPGTGADLSRVSAAGWPWGGPRPPCSQGCLHRPQGGLRPVYKTNIPLAVVEAKDNSQAVGAGMSQAIQYAQLLDVPFSFTSNGDGFVFRDTTLANGVLERNLALDEFPSPSELWPMG